VGRQAEEFWKAASRTLRESLV